MTSTQRNYICIMKVVCFLKTVCFFLLFLVLFYMARRLMIPKWNSPVFHENTTYSVSSFYAQEVETDDVVFLGTSHALCAISPMELYKNQKLVSYNIATSAQGIMESYVLAHKALMKQKPKVLVLDVSSLFFKEPMKEDAWEYLKTSTIGIRDTFELILDHTVEMTQKPPSEVMLTKDYWDQLLSLQYIRSRWKELGWNDFRDFINHGDYYTAGYYLSPEFYAVQGTLEDMNNMAERLAEDTVKRKREYKNGKYKETNEDNRLYDIVISDDNAFYLDKIAKLCSEVGTQLLLVKYPVMQYPNTYSSAWTELKSKYMKQFANENNYSFIDLLYDVDLGIDAKHDFYDRGKHLNYNGAKKVSTYMGKYLKTQYGLSGKTNVVFDRNMALYNRMTDLADMMLESDLPSYLNKLKKRSTDCIICIAVSNDMKEGLNDRDIAGLQALGLKSDFEKELESGDSYISVIDGGQVLYEALSNRNLYWEEKISDQIEIIIKSSGKYNSPQASIMINELECACNGSGINIVVIDKETGLVIDSGQFTISEADRYCHHKDSLLLLEDYWMRLLDNA